MSLAFVGETSLKRGKKTASLNYEFLLARERDTRLSTTLRSVTLCFRTFRLLQPVKLVLPFKTFRMHSLMLYTRSFIQFETMTLRSLGSAVFST